MTDSLEHNFFYRLRLITTLLIKHASPAYKDLLPLVQHHEEGTWAGLAADQKAVHIDKIVQQTGSSGEIHQHFSEFPHEWSRNQFQMFVDALQEYCQSLSQPTETQS